MPEVLKQPLPFGFLTVLSLTENSWQLFVDCLKGFIIFKPRDIFSVLFYLCHRTQETHPSRRKQCQPRTEQLLETFSKKMGNTSFYLKKRFKTPLFSRSFSHSKALSLACFFSSSDSCFSTVCIFSRALTFTETPAFFSAR